MSKIPRYSSERALLLAEERINHPSETGKKHFKTTSYEYLVGTWACTMLSKHFSDDFLITPEMFVIGTNKKPDFVIEKFCEEEEDRSKLHAVYVLKKKGGDYFDRALVQAANAITQLCDFNEGWIETFVIVQRGMEIGFFEFLSYTSMMEQAGITHFKSCVPLTCLHEKLLFGYDGAKSEIEQFSAGLPNTVMPLIYGHPGRKSTDSMAEADEIDTPCVFNLEIHKYEIEFVFHYIATQSPRSMED
jgi:hypothetical protein